MTSVDTFRWEAIMAGLIAIGAWVVGNGHRRGEEVAKKNKKIAALVRVNLPEPANCGHEPPVGAGVGRKEKKLWGDQWRKPGQNRPNAAAGMVEGGGWWDGRSFWTRTIPDISGQPYYEISPEQLKVAQCSSAVLRDFAWRGQHRTFPDIGITKRILPLPRPGFGGRGLGVRGF